MPQAKKRAVRRKGVTGSKYVARRSQMTGKPPTKRLKKRRAKAVAAPKKGYFPNPGKVRVIQGNPTESVPVSHNLHSTARSKDSAVSLSVGDEIRIRVRGDIYTIRATGGGSNGGSLQVGGASFGQKRLMYAGKTTGIFVDNDFSIGYFDMISHSVKDAGVPVYAPKHIAEKLKI